MMMNLKLNRVENDDEIYDEEGQRVRRPDEQIVQRLVDDDRN